MKKRNLYLSLTIMCGLFSVAFTFNMTRITWLWKGNEPVGILLFGMAIGFAILLYKNQKSLKRSD
jgi:hypothetical protein